jgi:hypothetical protein
MLPRTFPMLPFSQHIDVSVHPPSDASVHALIHASHHPPSDASVHPPSDASVHPLIHATHFKTKGCESYDARSSRHVRAFVQTKNVSGVVMLNELFSLHANGQDRVIFRILMELITNRDGIRDGNHRHSRDHNRQGSRLLRIDKEMSDFAVQFSCGHRGFDLRKLLMTAMRPSCQAAMHLIHGLLSKITGASLRSTTPVTGTLIHVTVPHENAPLAQAPDDPRAQTSDVSDATASATLEASALHSPPLEGEEPALPIGARIVWISPLQAFEEPCARISDSTRAKGPTHGASPCPAGRKSPLPAFEAKVAALPAGRTHSLPAQALEGKEFKLCVSDVTVCAGAGEMQGLTDLGPRHQQRMNSDDQCRRHGSSPTRSRTQEQLVRNYTPNIEMALHLEPHSV